MYVLLSSNAIINALLAQTEQFCKIIFNAPKAIEIVLYTWRERERANIHIACTISFDI
jgi:hypothetical protein